LTPARNDIRCLKQFLDETAEDCNRRIGERLAALLTTIHATGPSLFAAQEMADRLGAIFRLVTPPLLQVSGAIGVVPPD
jgi:hypothetical protein